MFSLRGVKYGGCAGLSGKNCLPSVEARRGEFAAPRRRKNESPFNVSWSRQEDFNRCATKRNS